MGPELEGIPWSGEDCLYLFIFNKKQHGEKEEETYGGCCLGTRKSMCVNLTRTMVLYSKPCY